MNKSNLNVSNIWFVLKFAHAEPEEYRRYFSEKRKNIFLIKRQDEKKPNVAIGNTL